MFQQQTCSGGHATQDLRFLVAPLQALQQDSIAIYCSLLQQKPFTHLLQEVSSGSKPPPVLSARQRRIEHQALRSQSRGRHLQQ